MVISAGPDAWLNRHLLGNRILVGIGLISYPLYLWHWALLSFMRVHEGSTPILQVRVAVVALSFVLSWITYKLIEIPIRAYRSVRLMAYFLGSPPSKVGRSPTSTMRSTPAFRMSRMVASRSAASTRSKNSDPS